MIEVKNLTKRYGKNTVVNNLNFKIESGKIYGFLGPNGAGKSTTMNMLTGCLAASEGEIRINGHDIYEEPIEAKKVIGYLPEQPPLYGDMTPFEYLSFVAEAKGISANERLDAVVDVMVKTGIEDMRHRLIKNLSKGYKQRVGIAQAMLGDPELIILDEPTVGLDPKQITEIRGLISELGETKTVILSSHILAEISAVCDHVMIISNGKLVASGAIEDIKNEYSDSNTLLVTIRDEGTNVATSERILGGTDGVEAYERSDDKAEGAVTFTVRLGEDERIGDKIFFAFAEAGVPIVKLTDSALTLEEIFLKLTDEAYSEDEPEDEVAMVLDAADGDTPIAPEDTDDGKSTIFSTPETEADKKEDEE